ncbi:MAG: prepilin peptidase [Nanobdellota archaeon]
MVPGVPPLLTHTLILVALVIASYIDLKKREVPDLINYTLLALGIIIASVSSIVNWTYHPLLSSLLGAIAGYLIALLMFYTGQWGGGDAKMIMAIGAFQGLSISSLLQGEIPLLLTTFISILFIGSLYSFIFMFGLILQRFKQVKKTFISYLSQSNVRYYRKIVLLIGVIGFVTAFLMPTLLLKLTIGCIVALIILGFYGFALIKTVEKTCLTKTVSLDDVVQGDWLARPITKNGKIICKTREKGLTSKQLTTLKEHNINKIPIKYGVPFIPGFLLGYIPIVIFGNWLSQLIMLL